VISTTGEIVKSRATAFQSRLAVGESSGIQKVDDVKSELLAISNHMSVIQMMGSISLQNLILIFFQSAGGSHFEMMGSVSTENLIRNYAQIDHEQSLVSFFVITLGCIVRVSVLQNKLFYFHSRRIPASLKSVAGRLPALIARGKLPLLAVFSTGHS
jgi:hypothetical protein